MIRPPLSTTGLFGSPAVGGGSGAVASVDFGGDASVVEPVSAGDAAAEASVASHQTPIASPSTTSTRRLEERIKHLEMTVEAARGGLSRQSRALDDLSRSVLFGGDGSHNLDGGGGGGPMAAEGARPVLGGRGGGGVGGGGVGGGGGGGRGSGAAALLQLNAARDENQQLRSDLQESEFIVRCLEDDLRLLQRELAYRSRVAL